MVISTIVTGVGGQGVVSTSDVIANMAYLNGFDVKKSDVHGMAQRGGAVISTVRFGEKVFSPIIDFDTADSLIALEELEGLRGVNYLKDNGILILSNYHMPTPDITLGYTSYPDDIKERIREIKPHILVYDIDVQGMLKRHPSYRDNMFLLGIYAKLLKYEKSLWLSAIEQRFKNPDNPANSFLYGYENKDALVKSGTVGVEK
ncbi:MAG: 2-oxoacid:acceptor oxidoreductase family protein [Deltaproteobacteria bacterium]|nr:2-oxoacid:acceptor oxidoreductase family protein [Deltaproteobacteria bacterium]MCL5792047.1 2-oxoacid:acceptor oxidoreductase family protein [Deltaproteobacteria bacterium]